MAKEIHLSVVTPAGAAFEGPAQSVQLPGAEGYFQVLANHAPLIAALGSGRMRVVTPDGSVHDYTLAGGVAEVGQNRVTVVADQVTASA